MADTDRTDAARAQKAAGLSLLAGPVLYRPDTKEELRIDRAEMLRYLGHAGQKVDGELSERIEGIAREIEQTVDPHGVIQAFPVDATGVDEAGMPCIRLTGTTIELRGRDIFRHLKDASACAVVACTLGMGTERRLRLLSGQRPLDAALYDAAASAYVEAAVDAMEHIVRREAAAAGRTCTWRFSCGYGDCPLAAQDAIVASLNAGRLIGLTTTPTHLLLPSKSVTALIGIIDGKDAAERSGERPSCAICRLRGNCAFRAHGTTCYA